MALTLFRSHKGRIYPIAKTEVEARRLLVDLNYEEILIQIGNSYPETAKDMSYVEKKFLSYVNSK
jgi:hypothetical protein